MRPRVSTLLSIAVSALVLALPAGADNPPNFGDPVRGLTPAQFQAQKAALKTRLEQARDKGLGR